MRTLASVLALVVVLAGSACGASEKGDALPDSLTRVVLEPTDATTASDPQLDLSVMIMNQRLQRLHVKDPNFSREGERIALIAPTGVIERSLPVLLRPGRLEFFDLQGDLTGPSLDTQGFPVASVKPLSSRPNTVVVTCGPKERYCPGLPYLPKRTHYYLFKYDPENQKHPIPEITGADLDLKGIRMDFDTHTNQPVVLMQFTGSGAKKFEDITQTLVERGRNLANQQGLPGGAGNDDANQQFAIVLDREMKSAPSVDFDDNPNGIPGNNGAQITGIPISDAKDLALVLQTGALPFAFRVVSKEERHK